MEGGSIMAKCEKQHHDCSTGRSCCKVCSEYTRENCIETDQICDCLWDHAESPTGVDCSLDPAVCKIYPDEDEANNNRFYAEHLKEKLPHNVEIKE